ncbi:MAG TPA: O-antigen ligase family protein, partial [Aggregatilineaceae bacterium]|nr:O-antigen ligase family protein [Aggregatilineaceae bacterium]
MTIKWLLWWGCILLVVGSGVGAWSTFDRRDAAVRGWENASQTLDLPYRVPLAGVNVDLRQYSPERLSAELDRIAAAGFIWVRQLVMWQDIESERGQYTWDVYDAIVVAVNAHKPLQLVAVLDGTPPWARQPEAPDHPFAPPASVGDFASFAGAVAARYADSITYYQVWDEPNIKSHWGNLDPRPAHYVAMLREAYTAIHAADGTANVIAAALAPTTETGPDNLSDILFLRAIYDQGGKGYFDAAAGKPYGFDTGPYDRRVGPGVMNFSRLILLREEMVRRGDGTKPLWGSNFGWNHLPDGWTGPPSIWGAVSAAAQEQYTREAYQRASQEWPWVGGLIVQHWQPDAPPDDPAQGFALAPVIDAWLPHGPLFDATALIPGMYPAQNPSTVYSGHWQFGELGADAVPPDASLATPAVENRITVRFEGTAFAMPVRRDDYLAYLYVTIDGKRADALPHNGQGEAFIVLTSPERKPDLDLILVAKRLSNGTHTAEIIQRPSNGDDRWSIAGFAVASPADTERYDQALMVCGFIGGLAVLGVVFTGRRLPWRHVTPPALPTVRQFTEWVIGLLASFVVLLGTLMTWGETIPSLLRRDQPALAITILTAGIASLSPVFVMTLAALAVLFVLIYNRPLLGVMLVIFWSAFFLSTLDLLFNVFATVELYFGLTLTALIARSAVTWARQYRDRFPAASEDRVSLRLLPLDWLVLAFVALATVSLTWSEFRSPAVRQLRIVVIEPAAFYFLIRFMHLERRDLVWLVDTLLFAGGAIAVVGLYLYFTGESVVQAENGARRLISVYGSPNGVGLYLGRCLPFALSYVLLTPKGSWRWLYGLANGAVMLLAVLFSQSRGAILLGLPAALIVLLIVWRGRQALVPVSVAVVGFFVVLIPLSLVLPRLAHLLGNTAMFRRNLWHSSLLLIREHPLTGVGLDQFLYWYRSRYL